MTRAVGSWLLAGALLTGGSVQLAAQSPADQPPPATAGRRGAPPGRQLSNGTLSNEEVYAMLDAFVIARARAALQLNDAQFSAFFQRMMRLQKLQAAHRRQRGRLLGELRLLVGPRAPAGVEEATIAAKTKELDDAEAQMNQDERKALADIDEVLQVRQRAHFRVFLESMERQKLELLIKARQSAGASAPAASPAPAPIARGGS